MRLGFGRLLTLISFLLLIGIGVFWVKSYIGSDSLRFSWARDGPIPWKVRTLAIYSGSGCIQFAAVQEAVLLPENQSCRLGFSHVTGNPHHPNQRGLRLGWQKSFAGFGITSDWDT